MNDEHPLTELVTSAETGVLFPYAAVTEQGEVVGHVAVKRPDELLCLALQSAGDDEVRVVVFS